MSRQPTIRVDRLDVRFGKAHVVRDVSFMVGEGESYGIVGESGSGKSTVLRVISGLNRLWTGRIAIRGIDQPKHRDKTFHRAVQMVFQDPYGSLHPKKTIDDALAEPLAIHDIADADRRIKRALDEVALPQSFRFRFPSQLSGGQRQRVAIARALILEPGVLLLDEPTSALDVSIQAEVLNLLQALRRERRLTYILVSHNLAVVAHMCERLMVMQAGRTVEETDVQTLSTQTMKTDYARQLLAASKGFVRAPSDHQPPG